MALELNIIGGPVQLSGNRVQVEVTTDTVQGSLYRLLLKTTSLDASFPEGIDAIEPDASEKAIFDLRNRVSMPVNYDFTWPLTGDMFIKHPQLAKKIQIDIGESFLPAVPPKQINWAGLAGAGSHILILKGAITKHTQAKYNETGKTFYQEYIEAGRFLTNLPANQRIAPGQPVKLWFISKETIAQDVYLKVDFTYLDGSTDSWNLYSSIDPDAMYEICADAGTIGINPAEIHHYTAGLRRESDNVSISEIRTYTIDHTYYEYNTFVFYANRAGGIDCLWFPGHIKASYPTESQTSERNAQNSDTQKKRTLEVDYKAGYRKFDINTGYRDVEEQKALCELLDSCDVWFIDGNDIIPVNLEDGDNLLYDTFDMQTNIPNSDLSFREAH